MAVDQKAAVEQAYPFIRRGDLEIKRAWAYLRALKRAGELPAYGSITIDQLFQEFTNFAYIPEIEAEGVEINEWWKNNSDVEGTGTILENVAALRALNSDSFSTNSIATVLGYWTRGDGGTGDYYLDLADIVSPDDNWSVIVDASGHRWKAIFENNIVPVERTGFQGIDTLADNNYLQLAGDAAPDWFTFAFSGREYVLYDRLFIRRNKQRWFSDNALIKAPDHDISGGLLQISNCDDSGYDGVWNVDVNNLPENGFAFTGNNTNAASIVVQPPQFCRRLFMTGQYRIKNATYSQNLKERIEIDRDPASFQIGESINTFSQDVRLIVATIFDKETVVIGPDTFYYLCVEYTIPRGSALGSDSVPKEIRGNTSGAQALVIGTLTYNEFDPYAGREYASFNGQFGGKGFTVQYGVYSMIIGDVMTENCAIGGTIESKVGALSEGEAADIICNNLIFRNCSRMGLWVLDASTDDSANIQNSLINNLMVTNCGADFPYVGAITYDRASNITIKNFQYRVEPDYAQPKGAWAIYGICRNCEVTGYIEMQNCSGIVDFRPHVKSSATQPGTAYAAINNRFNLRVKILGTVAATTVYGPPDYTLETNTVYANMIAWNPAFPMESSEINISVLGWTTTDYFNSLVSASSKFSIYDMDDGRTVEGIMISNPTFDLNNRIKTQGATSHASAHTFYSGAFFGANSNIFAGLDGSSNPFIGAVVPGEQLRLKGPNTSTRMRIRDDFVQIESSSYTIPILWGTMRQWLSSNRHFLAKDNTNPSSETDGFHIAARWGTATKSASYTHRVLEQMPVNFITGQVANITVTLSNTSAVNGDRAIFIRTDSPAFTVAFGAIFTIPSGLAGTAEFIFNGSAWVFLGWMPYRASHAVLARGTATVLAGGSSIVVNEALAVAGTRAFANAVVNDATGGGVKVVSLPAAGSFTITMDAAVTNNTDVVWQVIN